MLKASSFLRAFLFIPCLLIFSSCKKDNSGKGNTGNKEITAKITSWLNAKKSSSNQDVNTKIESLAGSLDFSGLRYEDLKNGEKFVIIPISTGFKTSYTKDNNTISNLLLILNQAGNIRKGNIVLFVAANGKTYDQIPENTFFRIFNNMTINSDGQFTFLSITGKHKYAVQFEKGKLHSYSLMKPKVSVAGANGKAETETCTDWYLVTTYTYEDGSTETLEQYVGTSCGDEASLPQDPGGGGSGAAPVAVTTTEIWVVGAGTNATWHVNSYEKLDGVKDTTEPGGGHFTAITHVNSSVFNNPPPSYPSSPSIPYTTYQQLAATDWVVQSDLAKSDVAGKVTRFDGADIEVHGIYPFAFFIEFP